MATVKLDLDDCPRTKVFRALDRILRDDPTLKRIFGRKGGYRSWTGDPADNKPLAVEMAPALRVTPIGLGPDKWYSPDSQEGDLGVDFEIVIKGTLVDDLMNVWWAIQRAIWPSTQEARELNANALRAAGSFSCMPEFLEPAFDAKIAETSGYFHAVGRMRIDVLMNLNP